MTTYDPRWRKSSHSNGNATGNCVELAHLSGEVAVRDSKDPSGPVLTFTAATLATFLTQATAGRFDVR